MTLPADSLSLQTGKCKRKREVIMIKQRRGAPKKKNYIKTKQPPFLPDAFFLLLNVMDQSTDL